MICLYEPDNQRKAYSSNPKYDDPPLKERFLVCSSYEILDFDHGTITCLQFQPVASLQESIRDRRGVR